MISCSKQANSSWVLWPWLCWLEVVSKLQCVIIGAFSSSDFDCNDFLANLTLVTGVSFKDGSSNLSLWEASLGSSYMCKKEQSFNITENLILNTFELQVQPFGVMNDQFNTGKIQPFIKTCLKLFKKKKLQIMTVQGYPILIKFAMLVTECLVPMLMWNCSLIVYLFSACSPWMLSGWHQPLNPNHCWCSSGCLDSHCSDCICDWSTKDICWISDPVMTSWITNHTTFHSS